MAEAQQTIDEIKKHGSEEPCIGPVDEDLMK
jgi:hypothetical protein